MRHRAGRMRMSTMPRRSKWSGAAAGPQIIACQDAPLTTSVLAFCGTDRVTMGVAPGLGLERFSLETWVRRDGPGTLGGTGAGGLSLVPLITKGRGETDGSNLDCNYAFSFFGDVLGASFEDMATGGNHPVYGKTPIRQDEWHHVAATYDGATAKEIAATMYSTTPDARGLVGHWRLDIGDAAVRDALGQNPGKLTGATFTAPGPVLDRGVAPGIANPRTADPRAGAVTLSVAWATATEPRPRGRTSASTINPSRGGAPRTSTSVRRPTSGCVTLARAPPRLEPRSWPRSNRATDSQSAPSTRSASTRGSRCRLRRS